VTIAKGLTSGYVPMSACLVSERIHGVLRAASRDIGPFAHGYTYSGHPVAAAAALANLAILERERLVENADRIGALLLADGVIARVVAGRIALSPPLVLGEDEVDELVAALARALDKFA